MQFLMEGLKWTPNPKSGKFQYQDPSGKYVIYDTSSFPTTLIHSD